MDPRMPLLWPQPPHSPGPQTVDLIPVFSSTGTRLMAPSMCWVNTSQSRSKRPKANLSDTCRGSVGEICHTAVRKAPVPSRPTSDTAPAPRREGHMTDLHQVRGGRGQDSPVGSQSTHSPPFLAPRPPSFPGLFLCSPVGYQLLASNPFPQTIQQLPFLEPPMAPIYLSQARKTLHAPALPTIPLCSAF